MFFKIKKEKGASAVEFAIVLPLLILMVFGIVQFGPAFFCVISLTHAAREAVRRAAVEEYVEEEVINGIPDYVKNRISDLSIVIEPSSYDSGAPPNDVIGSPVTATVSARYHFNIPLMGSWNKDFDCVATMRQEK
jgi:hypothetical protein